MNALVFIIKDKIKSILKEKRVNFANIDWELEDRDIVEIYENESDVFNKEIKPIYSIGLKDATYENPEFNREYEKFMIYKPNANIFEEFHIAFILHRENNDDETISMKIQYN